MNIRPQERPERLQDISSLKYHVIPTVADYISIGKAVYTIIPRPEPARPRVKQLVKVIREFYEVSRIVKAECFHIIRRIRAQG